MSKRNNADKRFPFALIHKTLGNCELLRIEGVNWIVRVVGTSEVFVFSPAQRYEFTVPVAIAPSEERQQAVQVAARTAVSQTKERRQAHALLESLRAGLPPKDARAFSNYVVALPKDDTQTAVSFLSATGIGGAALLLRGPYGYGKSLCLSVIAERALADNLVVMKCEVDSAHIRPDKPFNMYRELISSIRFPNEAQSGAEALAHRVRQYVETITNSKTSYEIFVELEGQLECTPLAWLFSDPGLASNIELLKLLRSEPGVGLPECRKLHCLPNITAWPRFDNSYQSDFACFLLSGLGRTCRLLGYSGLVILLDEMEKCRQLNLRQQSCARNFVGGLIWGATALPGARIDDPPDLSHSKQNGGYPFTTRDRNYVGIAIATTDRGEHNPESHWLNFGELFVIDIPSFSRESLEELARKFVPFYSAIYELPPLDYKQASQQAAVQWTRKGDSSARSAVLCLLDVLDKSRMHMAAGKLNAD